MAAGREKKSSRILTIDSVCRVVVGGGEDSCSFTNEITFLLISSYQQIDLCVIFPSPLLESRSLARSTRIVERKARERKQIEVLSRSERNV